MYEKLLQKTHERVFLDESKLDGRIINTKARPFILEAEGGLSYIERCKRDPDLPIYLTGIIQSGDKPNRNGRVYPWEYLKRECIRYIENEIKRGLSYGELDHPEDSTTPALERACWTIEDIWFKGTDVYARIKVLNAFMPDAASGKKIRGFILNGKSVGVSSRALGSLEKYSNSEYDIVADDLEMVCWDCVSQASNFGSEVLDLTESTNGLIINNKAKILMTESIIRGASINKSNEKVSSLLLTEEEKTYLNILGIEKFLQIHYQNL